MFKKTVFFSISCLIIIILPYSCVDDTINTEPPAGTIFFYRDSISIWFSPGINTGYSSITFEQNINASKVKVEYTIQTNVDSVHSHAWVKDSSNGSPPHPVEQYYYRSMDSLVNYIMDIPSQPVHLRLEVSMDTYNSIIPHYIKLKSIMVTKQ